MAIRSERTEPRLRPALLPRLLAGLVIVLLAQAFVLGVWHSWRFSVHNAAGLVYQGPLDGQEGTLLHEARLILRGEPLYQPLQLDRVVGAPYPPVHAYTLALAEWFANPNGETLPAEGRAIFAAGRAISLSATILTAILTVLIVQRLSGSLPVAIIAGLLLLAPAPVQLWATRVKPDPLALALTAAGLYAAIRACSSPDPLRYRRPLTIAALLFATAFFTKQTYIAAPLAVGASLLLGAAPPAEQGRMLRRLIKSRAAFLHFTAVYLGSVAIAWLLWDLGTGGQFTFHVWGLHPPEWWIYGRFLRYLGLLGPAWPLALLACGGAIMLLVTILRKRAFPPAQQLLPSGYVLLGVATIIGSGTIGSHHNHLLEPSLALTIAGGSLAGSLLRNATLKRAGIGAILAALLLLAQGWSFIERPRWYGGEFDLEQQNWQRFVTLIAGQPGEVLSDDVGMLLLAGKDPRYDDPPTMGPAARSNLWDQSGLLADVEAQRFDLIVLHFDATKEEIDAYGRWSPEFIAALRANYRLLYRDLYFSYVPN